MDPPSPAPSPESLFLEDFGQKVDLTRRIREVLSNYPEGLTVLKELIQNADDAGATKVSLCLDRRTHGKDSLLSSKLAQWQGPSLLAYNNSEFNEEDFVSISRIGGSSKQGQTWKTGRFGVGFNSVYHITDLPSFVSGKYVVLFDPQGVYLPNISAANPGKRIEFASSSAISLYEDQFLPFCAFGCDMKTHFPGTLFRFPLRNTVQAAASKLSRQVYSEDDISSLFVQLHEEGVLTLLFLKNVLCIDMYTWNSGEPEPTKIYSCSVNSVNNDTVWHRQALLRLSKSLGPSENEIDAFSINFLRENLSDQQLEKKKESYYIVQTMASTSSRIASFAATASKEYDMHLLPWASVAACMSDIQSNDEVDKNGRAFCFLPLPVRTGLRVHVNGYFEVSSNRRSIWYGEDMDRSGKMRSVWNRLLLEDVVAPIFTHLLLSLRELLGATSLYYTLWPYGSFDEPWSILVEKIYRNLANNPVLYSYAGDGKWVSPQEAFLHDKEFAKSKDLGDALELLGMPIVHLPSSLSDMLQKYPSGSCQGVVTPAAVRNFLRGCGSLSTLSRSYKLVLLEYCLDDLIDVDVGIHAKDLPLLPLANKDFGLLSGAPKGLPYFICNDLELQLLERISERVIDRDIPLNIFSRLSAIAECSKANLVVFNTQYLVQLFPTFVPPDWKYKSKVCWDTSCQTNHFTPSWFTLFWQYLREHCEKLSLFSDWPILPSTSGHLYRASVKSKLISAENLPMRIQVLLTNIGCKILEPCYGLDHPDLPRYVCNADAAGVLESIFDAVSLSGGTMQSLFSDVGMEDRDELRKFLLDPKWFIGNQMYDSAIWNCKRVPIYKVYDGCTIHFSDLLNPKKYLPPLDVAESFLGDEFVISLSKVEEDVLLRYFGVERMGKARFYKQQVLTRIRELQPHVRDSIMLSILLDLPQLCNEDATFRECIRDVAFVPTLSGDLKCPAMLYDPRNEELYGLLGDANVFPCGVFEESSILDMLQGLGLRTSVSQETVIQTAKYVERLMHEDQQKSQSRGRMLLSYLEVNAMKWLPDSATNNQGPVNRIFSRDTTAMRPRNSKSDLEKFWSDLQMICWCPTLASAPFETLPWPVVTSVIAPPKLVRLPSDMWLVSASMRILDAECSSTALSNQLGWSSPPGGSVIAAQLLELGKNNERVNDQVLRRELALAMPRLYSILSSMIGSDEMDIVKAVLEGSRWIWVGDGFATLDEVVLDGPLHLAPYIRVIPVDLAVFRELFLELGIREFLKPIDYANISMRMATRKGTTPLDTLEIRAAVLIAQHLAEVQFHERNATIYLPDISGRLLPASDLVYNDAPWLLGTEDSDSTVCDGTAVSLNARKSIQKFVHGNISNDVAERLGVCSLRRTLLAESADSMNLSLSGAAEAFGQHEALTTRLRHILEMYADGPGILFELVQNAEDAGASEVALLLDKTQYGTSSVLSPEMADWQGPALYCFNDSIFSPQDLYAISRIGQESKLEKPFAIGRFGLGFNCVYHFTDIPTFVSGENIVMFDPHACNLPGISPSHPGLRIKFVGKRILDQFPDQFSPFLHFGCDLLNSFPGTLFRFPLRSPAAASRSQIKREGYTSEEVMSLFSSFSLAVSEALLFLRNVKTISIYLKEGSTHEMQLLHRVSRNFLKEPETDSSAHNSFNFINGKQPHGKLEMAQFFNRMKKTTDGDLPRKFQKIIVTEESSSSTMSHCWVTSECLNFGQAKNTSGFSNSQYNSYIPWACVAAYLHSFSADRSSIDSSSSEDACLVNLASFQGPSSLQIRKAFEGRAFCFLPLPVCTGLPTHVNAYFELSSNRRDIWFGNDMAGGGKKRSDWNLHLLEDVAAPAYAYLLEKVALEFGPCDMFYSLWPMETGSEPWASMVRKIYNFVAVSGLRVLYTNARGGQWISAKQAIFPDFTFGKALELVEALSDAGIALITIPKPLTQIFEEVCPSLHYLTSQLLRDLLIRRKREFKEKNAAILALEYCLLDLRLPAQSACLYGLPLLPLANGLFTTFEKKGRSERIYITPGDEYGLLKDSISHQLVDSEIPEDIHRKLCDIAQSGESNVSFLTCYLLEKLLIRLLPVEWQNAKQATWVPGQHGQPSFEWMKLLWSYLNLYCDDLSIFCKWPILPIQDLHVLQLVESSNVIKPEGWSENMSSLLRKTGCLFLRSDMPIEHPQLTKYVQPSTATGLLNAILAVAVKPEKVEELFLEALESERHELRAFFLQSRWFSQDPVDDLHISIIKQIPMFESFRSRKHVKLCDPIKWLKPYGVRDELLDDNFIRAESERERSILSQYLGIREPSRGEFYKEFVLNRMANFLSHEGTLSAILDDVKLLVDEDSSAKDVLSMIPFVLAADGTWKQPSRLYDPRIPKLRKVLNKDAFFPSKKFADNRTLDNLVTLGLRRTLGFTGLVDCARSVSLLHDAEDVEALVCGRKLQLYLDALALKLSSEGTRGSSNEVKASDYHEQFSPTVCNTEDDELVERDETGSRDILLGINLYVGEPYEDKSEEAFWSEIMAIAWCPVCPKSPIPGLPWFKETDLVAAPNSVRPKAQMIVVSSSFHIQDGECSEYLQRKLGWLSCPKIDVLCKQLVELSCSYHQLKLNCAVEPELDAALQEGIPILYSMLQEYVGTDDFEDVKKALDGVSWVWIGDDFVTTNALAFDSPVKFSPYLFVVPSELSEFKHLLLELGVLSSFGIWDYCNVLQHLHKDVHGLPLSTDHLNFVRCVLEAIADCHLDKPLLESLNTPLLIPDSLGVLTCADGLVYNDAPWMENNTQLGKALVHPSISNDLANRLGIQSLRCLSLVDEEMAKDLPCMEYAKINELLALYGDNDFLLYDLLQLADSCKAKKLHLIFDKREHPRQSLLQHNLGEFQGPALVAILVGASLSREEITSLQLLPPWRLRGETLNYGLGLFSSYFICDLLSIISGGNFYIFDPLGLALGVPSSHAPAAKVFSLMGTNLIDRFRDQFSPLIFGQNMPWSSMDSTIIRMPLSSQCMKNELEDGLKRIKQIYDRFLEHSSRTLLFLKSVLQVSISTWEEGSNLPCEDFSVSIDSSTAMMRNPFSDKKWKKFQISRIFGSSSAASKMQLVDVNLNQKGTRIVDRWLVVLSLGSGQTRNMALDRKYLAYNLTPVAGVAAHISRDGHTTNVYFSSSILSPLPLSGCFNIPVTVLGCFLVCHNGGRHLFKYQDRSALTEAWHDAGNNLIEAWNRELMSCVCDSYVELVLEIEKMRRDPLIFSGEFNSRAVNLALKAYGDQIYSFWPRSVGQNLSSDPANSVDFLQKVGAKADWECLIVQVVRPFYARVFDLPLWQLYSGTSVKAEEGMFLSQPGTEMTDSILPATVCSFVKEHYPVFSVPWELVSEIQAVGLTVREIKPKMVRDLLRESSTSIVLRSVNTYVDVLEYCLSDIQLLESSNVSVSSASVVSESSLRDGGESYASMMNTRDHQHFSVHGGPNPSGDALEIVTNLGKALFDFGRTVVEDIGRASGPSGQTNYDATGNSNTQRYLLIAAELRRLPCPTGTNHLTRLGVTELWCGNRDQQQLMSPLSAKFMHPIVMDRSILADIFSNSALQSLLKLQKFSLPLLSNHMKFLFHNNWVNHVMGSGMSPWFSWENRVNSGSEGGPSPEWIRLFWRSFRGSMEELSLFSDWPLIPAFLGRPVLCRVKERHLVFLPPPVVASDSATSVSGEDSVELFEASRDSSVLESSNSYISAFENVKERYPWLLSLLNQCNIPVFDSVFIDCAAPCSCLPSPGQSLAQLIVSKLVSAKQAGYFPELHSFSAPECDELFALFASDISSDGTEYRRDEVEVLRALPIFKTVVGSYTKLNNQDLCMISSNSFLRPNDERCLSCSVDSIGCNLLRALGVPVLQDQQILVKFGLPGYESKHQSEQEDILFYIYTNWEDLQVDSSVVDALKETRFVRNADEFSTDLFMAKDLFDPCDALLTSVFSGERKRFPGERFALEGWLRILRKTGLRTAIEPDVMLECAKRVEFLGSECMKPMGDDDFETELSSSHSEVTSEIWSLAGSVVELVFSNFAVLYSNSFCNVFGRIACIPAEKGFPGAAGKIGGKRVLASYSEAVLWKDWSLAWNCIPIISRQCVPPEYSWGSLHLRSPPTFSTVLKHLQAIGKNSGEDTLAHWPNASGIKTIDECSCEILKYLDEIWDSLSASDVSELQRVAFIPAANGTRLVTASSLFARLTINLSPFAFELPVLYLPFMKILKGLGLQEVLTITCAKDILLYLQKACGYQRLNPNELRAVLEILFFVCDTTLETKGLDLSSWGSEAVVPDDGGRLVNAGACVYIDSYGSQFVKFIDSSRLRFVHPDLPERLCTALGIKKLSDVVIEEVDVPEQLQALEHIGSVPVAAIRVKLLSRSFQCAVWSVINSVANYIPALKHLSLEDFENSLKDIAEKLQFVKQLHTSYLLLPMSKNITIRTEKCQIPEWMTESNHRSLYFVSQSKTIMLVAEPPSYISIVDVIASLVSHVLGSPTPLPIGALFMCPENSESAVIDILKLCSENREGDQSAPNFNLIGKELMSHDAAQVQFHPLRPFYAGEIVAWRSQNGEKLKYGRVPENVRPSSGQALYRFKVDTAPAISENLLSSQVFSFRSVSMSNNSSQTTLVGLSVPKKRLLADVPGSSSNHSASSQVHPGKDLKYGRVSAGELVQAVHEMLSAAGIHMDVEKQTLLQSTLTLQEQLKESQTALLLEQEKSDTAAKEAETARAAWTCRICLSAEVDLTLVPCGHVLCRRCSSAISKCPFCRVQVSKTMKIYRP